MKHRLKQLRDIANGLRLHRHFARLEHGTSETLRAYQSEQLQRVVRHAVKNSPFYGEICRDIDISRGIRLRDLPIVDKRLMMENFDQWVADPRLKLGEIERQIETDPEDQYYLGEYRIVATASSSGLRGIFVYDRSEWGVVIAASLRWAEMFGKTPIQLSNAKIATIIADKPTHATRRLGQSMSFGLRNVLWLDATKPLSEIVPALNTYQPSLLMGYASLVSLLAVEQMEGRLNIAPDVITTFSELLSEDRTNRVRKAWGVRPFNHYGAAETVMIAAECAEHRGLHHFTDMSIVEIVDDQNKPVPAGTPGHKILLTNLHKFVQPVIRYEITDLVTEAVAPCNCHRPFPLFSQIGGRTEEILYLPGEGEQAIPIPPLVICDCLLGMADIIEFQYHFSENVMHLKVVPRNGAARQELGERVRGALTSTFTSHGAMNFTIELAFVDHLMRSDKTMGKLKIVEGKR